MSDPIKIKFTWADSVPVIAAVLSNGTAEGRQAALKHLTDMADVADLAQASIDMNGKLLGVDDHDGDGSIFPPDLLAEAQQLAIKAQELTDRIHHQRGARGHDVSPRAAVSGADQAAAGLRDPLHSTVPS